MLQIPSEYILALQEVLSVDLSNEGLRSVRGREFIGRTADSVMKLSHGLTRERAGFASSKYLNDPKIREAYLCYYTTTNLLKIWPPLRELSLSGFFVNRTELRQLDIGTGTGAAVWGLATYLMQEQPSITKLVVEATDSLNKNLKTVEGFGARLQNHLKPLSIAIKVSGLDLSLRSDRANALHTQHDVITLMNVLNEVDESLDDEIIAMLRIRLADDGAIVMIEPASREESRRALRFRDRMVRAGFFVHAPCCKTGSCPALAVPDNWCHTEVPWQRPDFIKEIDDHTGTLRLSLKSTYSVYLKKDLNLSDRRSSSRDFVEVGRVVSERFDEKGRVRLFVCNELGRREFIMNKRDKSPMNADALKTERFDLVQMSGMEERNHDVKIGGEAVFHTLFSAEGCENVDKPG